MDNNSLFYEIMIEEIRRSNTSTFNYSEPDPKILHGLATIGTIFSCISFVVHLYKFICAGKQNLPSKNLASYCLGSLLLRFGDFFAFKMTKNLKIFHFFDIFFIIITSFLAFNISLDTCIVMRTSVRNFQNITGPRPTAFVWYSILGWCVPVCVCVIFLFTPARWIHDLMEVLFCTEITLRLICVILFCISVRLISSVTVDRTRVSFVPVSVVCSRLLILFGLRSVICSVNDIVRFIHKFVIPFDLHIREVIYAVVDLHLSCEGCFIFLMFTRKQVIFKDANERMVNSYSVRKSREAGDE